MNAIDPALRVSPLTEGARGRWDAFVAACPEATFFHRSGWKPVIERSFGHPTHYLMAERDGAVCGVLPLVHVRSRLFGSALVSTPFAVYGGPAATSESARAALDAAALSLAERLGVAHVEFRSRERQRPAWACKDEVYATFVKPIQADPQANLLAIPRKQRAVVRKSLTAGLVARTGADPDRLYDVYAESVHRLGTPVFTRRYFRELKREFGADCELLTIHAGDRLVSGVLSFYFRDTVLPYYAGGRDEARKLGAFDFMYWDLMRRAGEAGCRAFDFGRSKRGTGAFDFKRNWGFEPTPLHYEYHLRRGGGLPNLSPLNPKYRLMVALWRRLPLAVASAAGPWLARSLG
ncbi:MAG: FemAB family XrtA/PEP-CTERM system-associated protein [Dongiaceae bacterium]